MSKTSSFKVPPPEYYKTHLEHAMFHGNRVMAEIYARIEPIEKIKENASSICHRIINWHPKSNLMQIISNRGVNIIAEGKKVDWHMAFWRLMKTNSYDFAMLIVKEIVGDPSSQLYYISRIVELSFELQCIAALECILEAPKVEGCIRPANNVHQRNTILGYIDRIPYYFGYRDLMKNILRHKILGKFDYIFQYFARLGKEKMKKAFIMSTEYMSLIRKKNSTVMILKNWLKHSYQSEEEKEYLYKIFVIVLSKFPNILKDKKTTDMIVKTSKSMGNYHVIRILHLLLVRLQMPVDSLDAEFILWVYSEILNGTIHITWSSDMENLFGILSQIVDFGINKKKHQNGMTELCNLIHTRMRCKRAVIFCLNMGACPMIADDDGNNALHHAALNYKFLHGADLIFQELLSADGIDVNATNNDDFTPLEIINRSIQVPPAQYQLILKANEM